MKFSYKSIFSSVALWSIAVLWIGNVQAQTPIERGTYLMQTIAACGNCHTPQGPEGPIPGREMAGMADFFEIPEFTIHSPNITPDPETGIGNWTDAQIITAIREGRRPDGSMIGPIMPIGLYRDISDTDVQAIVAYLRQVPPVRHEVPRSVFNIPIPSSYGPPVVSVADVPRNDQLAYGAYLAGPVGHCIECHTPMTEGHPDFANKLGAGGLVFPGPWGTSVSSNITPTGLAARTDEELKRMITSGTRPDGSKMQPPMPYAYYAGITDADLDAIIVYLRSLPPR
jgi:mono/diheme cytochrome c family protein